MTPSHPSLHTLFFCCFFFPIHFNCQTRPSVVSLLPAGAASPLEGFADLLPPAGRLLAPVGPGLAGLGPPVVVVSPRHEEARVARRGRRGGRPSSASTPCRRLLVRRSRGEEAPVGCHVSGRWWSSTSTSSSSCSSCYSASSSSSNSSSLEDAVEEVVQVSRVARTARVLRRRPVS